MKTYLVAFVLAAVVAILMTPLARQLAPRIGAVDLPSGRRVNKKAIPRLGGIAILAGFLAPLFGLYFYDNRVSELFHGDLGRSLALILGAIAIAALGALDDIKGTRAIIKLLVQIVVAVGAYGGGFRIETITLPFVGHLPMGIFAAPVTVFWIVGVVNAVNLLDGLDGLAAGVSFFVCVVSFVTGLLSHNVLVCLLAVSLGGALVGFLFFNFNPATIFMGDTGSMFIGYILATTSLLGSKGGTAVALLVPILAMGVPIIDTLLAIVRRVIERRPIFSPDKGHLHHRLLDMGLTHRRAVLAIYGLSALFTTSAIVVYLGRTWQIGLALAVATALVFTMIRVLGIVHSAKAAADQRNQRYDAQTELLRGTVPRFIRATQTAASGADVLARLTAFAERSNLRYLGCEGGAVPGLGNWHWESSAEGDAHLEGYISAKYLLRGSGPGPSYLKFAWLSNTPSVAAETAILLQLVTDVIGDALKDCETPEGDLDPMPAGAEPVVPPSRSTITGEC